jgi:hypothetical protein
MSAPPTPSSLRRLIGEVLSTDSDFEAFCLDYFPQVAKRFANGNDRLQKLNLLLRLASHEEILAHLSKAHSEAVRQHEVRLEYISPPIAFLERKRSVLMALCLIFIAASSALVALHHFFRQAPAPVPTPPQRRAMPPSVAAAMPVDGGSGDLLHPPLPILKILNERQRKDAHKLTAPISSLEKFFQTAIDLGKDAELVTYKKIDPAQRQWITQVVLVDGKTHRPVTMIIYSESQYRSWVNDVSTLGEAVVGVLTRIEQSLKEISEYKTSADQILNEATQKEIEDAWFAYRFQNYPQALQIAKKIAQTDGETTNNKLVAWQIVGRSACAIRRIDLATDATRNLNRLRPGAGQAVAAACNKQ